MLYINPHSDISELLSNKVKICIPIPTSWQDHDLDTDICALYICLPDKGIHTIIPIDIVGEEAFKFELTGNVVLSLKSRLFSRLISSYQIVYDLETLQWITDAYNPLNLDFPREYQNLLQHYDYVNRYIPLLKHLEYCEYIIKQVQAERASESIDTLHFYSKYVLPSVTGIEESEINVDREAFKEIFKREAPEKIRCNYKLFTSTGRPSNSYKGINLAALTKGENSQRSFIIPTHQAGFLVEYDFNAYHPRIIANLMNFPLPRMNFHEYIGREYFGVESKLTPEQYDESKRLTFQNLYSTKPAGDVEFFKAAESFASRLWDRFEIQGYVRSHLSYRDIRQPPNGAFTKTKLFNYYIQATETEFSMLFINDVLQFIRDHNLKSRLVMYTYDSFLLDYHPEDDLSVLADIKNVFEESDYLKNLSVKVNMGRNYSEMVETVVEKLK